MGRGQWPSPSRTWTASMTTRRRSTQGDAPHNHVNNALFRSFGGSIINHPPALDHRVGRAFNDSQQAAPSLTSGALIDSQVRWLLESAAFAFLSQRVIS